MTQKDEAERLRIGVRGGWVRIDDAVAWADSQIERGATPHRTMADLALAGNRSREHVVALLDAIPGAADAVAVMRCCLSDILKVVEREPGVAADAARWLEAAAYRGELPQSAFGSEAFGLADVFSLAEQGLYGTVEEARERLISFLRSHAAQEA